MDTEIRPEKIVVWLHGDHLRADNPALAQYPNAPVVFIFDVVFLSERLFAFHRLFFLYEAVMDVFAERGGICSIRRGRVPEDVIAFAREQEADCVVTTATLGSRFETYRDEIRQSGQRVKTISVPSLVEYDAAEVPRRFSVWWRQIEEQALKP